MHITFIFKEAEIFKKYNLLLIFHRCTWVSVQQSSLTDVHPPQLVRVSVQQSRLTNAC